MRQASAFLEKKRSDDDVSGERESGKGNQEERIGRKLRGWGRKIVKTGRERGKGKEDT